MRAWFAAIATTSPSSTTVAFGRDVDDRLADEALRAGLSASSPRGAPPARLHVARERAVDGREATR